MSVEKLTFTYTDENDWSYDVSIVLDMYNDSHNLFVAFEDCDDSSGRMIPLTMDYEPLPYLQTLISVSFNEKEVLDFLLNNNLGELTGETVVLDGFKCFVFQFKEDVLERINPLFFAEYRKMHDLGECFMDNDKIFDGKDHVFVLTPADLESSLYVSDGLDRGGYASIEAVYIHDYVMGVMSRLNCEDIDGFGIYCRNTAEDALHNFESYVNYLEDSAGKGNFGSKAGISDEELGYLKKLTDLSAGRNLDAHMNDESWFIRYEVARNKHRLDVLVKDPDKRVRVKVAEIGEEQHLKVLVDDPDWVVRQTVASRGYGLDKLINDPHRLVREEAAKQLYGNEKTKVVLKKDLDAEELEREGGLSRKKIKKGKGSLSKSSETKKPGLTERIQEAEKIKEEGPKNLYVSDKFRDVPDR